MESLAFTLKDLGWAITLAGTAIGIVSHARAADRRKVRRDADLEHRVSDLERREKEAHSRDRDDQREARDFRKAMYAWRDESKAAQAEMSERLVRLETLTRNGGRGVG